MEENTETAPIAATRHATPSSMPRNNGSIALFLVLTVLFSGILRALMIDAGHSGAGIGHYVVGLMWMPALAAFLALRFRRGDLASLGLSAFGGKNALLGYTLPLFYAAVAYGLQTAKW